ncbi:MAG: hypothetical protein ACREDZ_00335 [Kiloniellales bacterium]
MMSFGRIFLLSAAFGLLAISGVQAQTVIASTDGESPGVRLDVTEVKRGSGGTLTVKFTIVNDSSERFGFGYKLGDADYKDVSNIGGVHLLDATNKKKYLVMRDSEKKCVCSSKLKDVEAGKSLNLWAKFPAPPEDVQAVSIVVPGFIPLDDVAISQ